MIIGAKTGKNCLTGLNQYIRKDKDAMFTDFLQTEIFIKNLFVVPFSLSLKEIYHNYEFCEITLVFRGAL